jgi:hypothetical protein
MPVDIATAGGRIGRPRVGRYHQHRDRAASVKKN